MDAFPAFFPLAGKTVVIVGAGEAADAKARLFDGSPAAVVRIEGEAALNPKSYEGAALAFVASDDDAFETEVVKTSDAVRKVDPTRPTMTDGGGATKSNKMPVQGDHYTAGPFWEYPSLAYTNNTKGGGRGRWEGFHARAEQPVRKSRAAGGTAQSRPAFGQRGDLARLADEGVLATK